MKFLKIFLYLSKKFLPVIFLTLHGAGYIALICLDMKFYIFGPDLIMDFLFSVIRVNKNNINEHKNQADKNVKKSSKSFKILKKR